jgi:hypothetical protein
MLSLQSSTLNYLSVLPPFSKEDSPSAIFFFRLVAIVTFV